MIRVVLDTNIVVSALLQAQGLPARTFLMTIAGTAAQLCVSGDVYAEYEEVIRRPKFRRSEMVIEQTLRAIRQNGFWVKPSEKARVCPDPDDDIFLPSGTRSLSCDRQPERFPYEMGLDSNRDGPPIS
jgi:putative PIN family toxin of toxin-antitoxin system